MWAMEKSLTEPTARCTGTTTVAVQHVIQVCHCRAYFPSDQISGSHQASWPRRAGHTVYEQLEIHVEVLVSTLDNFDYLFPRTPSH
jgi:hypothetical protein